MFRKGGGGMFALLFTFFGCLVFPHASPGFFPEEAAENSSTGSTLMKRNVVACIYSMAAVTLMAACQQTPDAAKTLDPSGLRIGGDAINWNTNEKDYPWGPIADVSPCTGDVITITGTSHVIEHFGFDSMGGSHITSNVVSRGVGVGTGPNPKQYTIFDQDHFADQAPPNAGGFVIMDKLTMKVTAPTNAENYTTVFQDKQSGDMQGNFTAMIIKDSTNTCG